MSQMVFPGNALPGDVLSGKTFSASQNFNAAGTLTPVEIKLASGMATVTPSNQLQNSVTLSYLIPKPTGFSSVVSLSLSVQGIRITETATTYHSDSTMMTHLISPVDDETMLYESWPRGQPPVTDASTNFSGNFRFYVTGIGVTANIVVAAVYRDMLASASTILSIPGAIQGGYVLAYV